MKRLVAGSLLCLLVAPVPTPAVAGELLVAVAANFSVTARHIGDQFSRQSGHDIGFAVGSTGKLYAQITQGAPFDVLLAADQERPSLLLAAGKAVADTQFSYAQGRLAVWTSRSGSGDSDPVDLLRDPALRRLAIANPQLAPYGRAAQQVLKALEVWESLAGRIVYGENVAQAFAMAASGNAELALVAASQVPEDRGSSIPVAASLHDPIRQDAILLTHGADNRAAQDFLRFLRSAATRNVIRAAGYAVD